MRTLRPWIHVSLGGATAFNTPRELQLRNWFPLNCRGSVGPAKTRPDGLTGQGLGDQPESQHGAPFGSPFNFPGRETHKNGDAHIASTVRIPSKSRHAFFIASTLPAVPCIPRSLREEQLPLTGYLTALRSKIKSLGKSLRPLLHCDFRRPEMGLARVPAASSLNRRNAWVGRGVRGWQRHVQQVRLVQTHGSNMLN